MNADVDPVLNPYSPGAGRRPPQLTGREEELERFDVTLRRVNQGHTERGTVFTGLRGVGKTVMLSELTRRASHGGSIVVSIEASMGKPLAALAAPALQTALRRAQGRFGSTTLLRRAAGCFRSFSLSVEPDGRYSTGLVVDPASQEATGALLVDLTLLAEELGRAAADLEVGVVLFIDEMQDVTQEELDAVCHAQNAAQQLELPFLVVGAGLPGLPTALEEARPNAEHLFEYRTVGPLGDDDAAYAIRYPSEALGVDWEDDALVEVLSEASGYPYFLQVFASAVWEVAISAPIGSTDTRIGILAGRTELDRDFYGARWERATPAQQQYLRAVAADQGHPASTAAVASRLNRRRLSDVSVFRDGLIKKGLLFAPDRGMVAFTVPGMADFVNRQS
jgi:hypothetical protein